MSHLFYDHIIAIHEVHSEVESLDLPEDEKIKIIELIEDTIHHRVIHVILDHLDHEHHIFFLEQFKQNPHHESILEFLKGKIISVEDKIKDVADETKFEILATIRDHS